MQSTGSTTAMLHPLSSESSSETIRAAYWKECRGGDLGSERGISDRSSRTARTSIQAMVVPRNRRTATDQSVKGSDRQQHKWLANSRGLEVRSRPRYRNRIGWCEEAIEAAMSCASSLVGPILGECERLPGNAARQDGHASVSVRQMARPAFETERGGIPEPAVQTASRLA
jgi:hypothetical protein